MDDVFLSGVEKWRVSGVFAQATAPYVEHTISAMMESP